MSDYIKREDALEVCEWYQQEYTECAYALDNLTNEMRRLHPADVVERKRGKWVYDHWCEFKCSNCGAWSTSKPYRARENFCPNCGADMRNPTYTLSTESGTFSFRNTTQSNDSNALEKDGDT